MTILRHHPESPAEPPPVDDREAELMAERRELCSKVAELRAENHELKVQLDRAQREAAHLRRALSKRW